MKKYFNYTLFLFLVLSFYIIKVNARVDNNGDWIWDYCTYTLNDVDTLDTMIVNGEITNENLITIINAKDSEVGGKCRSEKIDGKWYYYDTKGNEITKDEWPNKCQYPVPTGSQIPFVAIIFGAVLVVLIFIIVKKKTKIKTI